MDRTPRASDRADRRIASLVGGLLERQGLLDRDPEDPWLSEFARNEEPLAALA